MREFKDFLKISHTTNYFGSMTRKAVIAFQKDHNKNNPSDKITVDGKVGPQTVKRINN